MDDEVTPLYHPTVQFTQLDAPACSWYVPLAHAEHKGACSLAKRPGSHCVQFDARDPDDLPATHAVQLMARPLLYVPPEHPSHDVAAISFRVNEPSPQSKQPPPPCAVGAYLPYSQSTHKLLFQTYCPAEQSSQPPRVAVEILPSAHGSHSEAPVSGAYVDSGHTVQLSGQGGALVSEYRPIAGVGGWGWGIRDWGVGWGVGWGRDIG